MGLGTGPRLGQGWWGRAKTGTGFKGCGHPTSESPAFWASLGSQTGDEEESRPKGDPCPQAPSPYPSGIGTRPEAIT